MNISSSNWTISWVYEAVTCEVTRIKIILISGCDIYIEYFTDNFDERNHTSSFTIENLDERKSYNVTVIAVSGSGEEIGTAASLSLIRESGGGKLNEPEN